MLEEKGAVDVNSHAFQLHKARTLIAGLSNQRSSYEGYEEILIIMINLIARRALRVHRKEAILSDAGKFLSASLEAIIVLTSEGARCGSGYQGDVETLSSVYKEAKRS